MTVHKHHRKLRSQGGTDDPVNILLVSPSLHRFIHDHPAESYAKGWLVRSWEDPAVVPVVSHPELRLYGERVVA